jgi:uncharacterized DUF497 family protein
MFDDFEWDTGKAETNRKKHGISFSDAAGVFDDPEAIGMYEEVVDGEEREVILGIDNLGRTLVVVYTFRGAKIRMISARAATKKEAREYERRIRF